MDTWKLFQQMIIVIVGNTRTQVAWDDWLQRTEYSRTGRTEWNRWSAERQTDTVHVVDGYGMEVCAPKNFPCTN